MSSIHARSSRLGALSTIAASKHRTPESASLAYTLFSKEMPSILALGIAVVLALAVRLWQYLQRPLRSPLTKVIGPETVHWWFGAIPVQIIQRNLLAQWLQERFSRYGTSFSMLGAARQQTLVTRDPVAVQYIMLSASAHYVKSEQVQNNLATHFGGALLASEGEHHRRHRKVAWPAFTSKAVTQDMGADLLVVGDDLIARLRRMCKGSPAGGTCINAYAEFTRAALDAIGLAGFNYRFGCLADEETPLAHAFDEIVHQLVSQTPYKYLRLAFPGISRLGRYLSVDQKELDSARTVVDRLSQELFRAAQSRIRKETGDLRSIEGHDLLSLLVKSNMAPDVKPSERMSDEEVISMVLTFLAAGHETTSSALSWAAYAFTTGAGPQKQERLRRELLDPENDGWQNDVDKLMGMTYLDAVCKEVLRLHPPVRAIRRTCTRNDVIPLGTPICMRDGSMASSVAIAKGDGILVNLHELNTCEEIWGDDGTTFRPERFLSPQHPLSDGRPLPEKVLESKLGWNNISTFTIGPRNCIGMRLAFVETKVLLAKSIANFFWLPVDETAQVQSRFSITARPIVEGVANLYMPCKIVPVADG